MEAKFFLSFLEPLAWKGAQITMKTKLMVFYHDYIDFSLNIFNLFRCVPKVILIGQHD